MHVENFKLSDNRRTGSLKIKIGKKDLLDLLETHHYFCHVFRHVVWENFDDSFNVTPVEVSSFNFLIDDIIHPFKEKLPNRFIQSRPCSCETITVLGMYMKAKFRDSDKYRANLVYAMNQDVFVWDLKFAVFD